MQTNADVIDALYSTFASAAQQLPRTFIRWLQWPIRHSPLPTPTRPQDGTITSWLRRTTNSSLIPMRSARAAAQGCGRETI
jgi:hypothetical protein